MRCYTGAGENRQSSLAADVVIHVRRDALPRQLGFVGLPDRGILVLVLDQRAALFDRGVNAGADRRDPDAQGKLLAAAAQRQLQRALRPGIKMLMEPIGRRAENAARHPVDPHHLSAETVFIGPGAQMVGPHERIALRAQDQQHRAAAMKMRLMVTPHRPLGEMADQGIIGNLKLGDIDPRALLFLSVELRQPRIGNEVSLPNPLAVVRREITFDTGIEVTGFAIIAIVESKFAVKYKSFVVIMIERHGRGGDREK